MRPHPPLPRPHVNNQPYHAPNQPLPSSTIFSASVSNAAAPTPKANTHNPDATTNINLTTANTSYVDCVPKCPHCDRTFASHIGMFGHLRIHRTESGKPVPGVPTYNYRIRLNWPYCSAHSATAWTYNSTRITVRGSQVKTVDKFAYRENTFLCSTNIDDEIVRRPSKASQARGQTKAFVWKRHGLLVNIKLKMYKAVASTTLLSGTESKTVYTSHARKLTHFHFSCLRRILSLRWQGRTPDTEVLRRTEILGIHAMLRQLQL
ncbi:hypothetical protein SprV_0200873400 [Sparganum proliferum]